LNKAATSAEAFAQISAMEAPLHRKLAAYADSMRELNSPFAAAYDRLVARLKAGEAGRTAPAIGEIMPDFLLPDGEGRLRSLADFLATGPLVMSFNRGHWCPFCRLELRALAEVRADLDACKARIISIMPENQLFAARLRPLLHGHVEVLSDIDNSHALALGLMMRIDDGLRPDAGARPRPRPVSGQ
jgi:peroxiredoxin